MSAGRRHGHAGRRARGAYLVDLQRGGEDAAVLVCFPPAASGPSWFRPLLPPGDLNVLGVNLPGRERRANEEPLDDLTLAAGEVAAELAALDLGRVAFVGHSMGALLAFETARSLDAASSASGRVALLAVSGHAAPSCPIPTPHLHRLTDAELIDAVRQLGGVPEIALRLPDLRTLMLRTLRADMRACETYRYDPDPPLRCELLAVAGDCDPRVGGAQLAAWAHHTEGSFHATVLPGGHFYETRHWQALLRTVARRLRPATAPPSGGDT